MDPLATLASATRPMPAPPELHAVHRRVHRRRIQRRGVRVAAGFALAATLLLAIGVAIQPEAADGLRARGVVGGPDLAVQLAVVGAEGPRAVRTGQSLSLAQPLVFRVRAGAPGEVRVTELRDGRRSLIFEESVPTGTTVLGGRHIQGWTPDHGPGTYAYEVRLCTASGACTTWRERLSWTP